jgi:hypothetical protein
MRRRRLIALGLLPVLVAASVSYTGRYTLDIVDNAGRPQTAYAVYHHQGESLSVHPVSYNATPMRVVRTDDTGRLTIPAAFHLHLPFPLQTHPKLWIEMVYVPRLHNAGGRIGPGYAASLAGAWEMDATGHRAVVFDASDRPERWKSTLSNLSFFMDRIVRDAEPSNAVPVLEIIGHFRTEYDAFLARHGDVLRPVPPMPQVYRDDEKRRWKEMVDADLAQQPTWGMEMRRLYEGQLSSLNDVAAGLKR